MSTLPHSPALLLPTLSDLPHLPSSQGGASVSGIVMFLLCLGIIIKLSIGIVPAQIGDYQLDKAIKSALKKSNNAKENPQQFMKALESQLSINGTYLKPEDILTVSDPTPGQMSVHKEYQEVSNLFGNVDIVNRFTSDITAADAQAIKD